MDTDDFARPEDITAVLGMHRVAIVGLSGDPMRPSHSVGHYLKLHGYDVVPVNPTETEVMGMKSYASLSDLPQPPEVVDVFRRSEALPAVVDEAIAAGAKAIWFQLGVVNLEAARKARRAGLITVMDRCMEIESVKRKT